MADIPLYLWDPLLVLVAVISAIALSAQRSLPSWASTPVLFKIFLVILVYATISISWSDAGTADATAMLWTLVVGAAAAIVGVAACARIDIAQIRNLLWYLTVLMAVISTVYFIESYYSLGLRTEAALWNDFGIQRLKGPLLGSSVGHFVLLPAFGCALDRLFSAKGRRVFAWVVCLLIGTAILALGSRSAMLGLGAFACFVAVRLPMKRRILFLLAVGAVVSLGLVVVFSRASSDRLMDMNDQSREATYRTAFEMFRTAPIPEQLFGSGYGSRWPWYIMDKSPGGVDTSSAMYFRSTAFGYTLYHPHSTFIMLAVELGVVGFGLGCALVLKLLSTMRTNARSSSDTFLSIAMVASLSVSCVDLTFFKNSGMNAVWWIYACGAGSIASASRDRKQPSRLLAP
jgi:O-antigen ligase